MKKYLLILIPLIIIIFVLLNSRKPSHETNVAYTYTSTTFTLKSPFVPNGLFESGLLYNEEKIKSYNSECYDMCLVVNDNNLYFDTGMYLDVFDMSDFSEVLTSNKTDLPPSGNMNYGQGFIEKTNTYYNAVSLPMKTLLKFQNESEYYEVILPNTGIYVHVDQKTGTMYYFTDDDISGDMLMYEVKFDDESQKYSFDDNPKVLKNIYSSQMDDIHGERGYYIDGNIIYYPVLIKTEETCQYQLMSYNISNFENEILFTSEEKHLVSTYRRGNNKYIEYSDNMLINSYVSEVDGVKNIVIYAYDLKTKSMKTIISDNIKMEYDPVISYQDGKFYAMIKENNKTAVLYEVGDNGDLKVVEKFKTSKLRNKVITDFEVLD